MEQPDQAMTRRVWQRVTGQTGHTEQPLPQNPKTMIATEEQIRLTLLHLMQIAPMDRQAFAALASDCARHIRILQGIHMLQNGCKAQVRGVAQTMSTPTHCLQRLYALTLQSAEQYGRLSSDTAYGTVFQALADTKAKHCAIVLQLLGAG